MPKAPQLVGWRRAVVLAGLFLLTSNAPLATAQQGAPTSFATTYSSFSAWTESCSAVRGIVGREPADGGRHPVFVYLVATAGAYDGSEATKFVEEMAARGFVAASVEYDMFVGVNAQHLDAKSRCIFDAGTPASAISALCARPTADCDRGIVVAGFSQGGYLAARAHNHEPRVRGVYAISLSDAATSDDHREMLAPWPTGTRSLPGDRLRIVNGRGLSDELGEGEQMRRQLNELTASDCALTAYVCLSPQGSGWYVVQHTEVADGFADHCYFHGGGGCSLTPQFDPGWLPPSPAPWGLAASLDWLAAQLARPPVPPATPHGLLGVYFNGPDFNAPAVTRIDPRIDFDWAFGSPAQSVGWDMFSVRWTGHVRPATSQTYTFYARSDDGMRVWLDGRLLIDSWNESGLTEKSASVALIAGTEYAIKVEHHEDFAEASARLMWSTPTIAKQAVPTLALTPGPEEQPPPAPPSSAPPVPPASGAPVPPSGASRGIARTGPAAARLKVHSPVRIRRGRVPVTVSCALACEVRLTLQTRDHGKRTGLRFAMPGSKRTLRVPVDGLLLRAARRRAIRLLVTARIAQAEARMVRRQSFSARALGAHR